MRRVLAFLTPLPTGRSATTTAPDSRTLDWFPIVGAFLGAAVGGVWWTAGRALPLVTAAVVALAADLVLTGLLHVDGLVDAADGLLPPLPRERRLAVMSTPEAGAFGVATLVVVLLARFAAFAVMRPSVGLAAGVWCASRTAMASIARLLPYARGDSQGLASPFLGRRAYPALLGGTSLSLVLTVATQGVAEGFTAICALAIGSSAVAVLAYRRVGGFTGDVLGAAGVIGETAGLLAAAARW